MADEQRTVTEAGPVGAGDTPVEVPERRSRRVPLVFEPGDSIGRYQVRGLLGAGGMGQVFAAFDAELGRTVALKLVRPDGRGRARARTRLLREAQALARLRHPNVVTIYDVGTQGDQVFIAMELVDGPTLKDWLAVETRAWPALRDVFLDAGRGLAAAHAAGIVHRDFKPSNVIVGGDRVVVLDFGVARADGDEELLEDSDSGSGPSLLGLNLTLTGERVGTLKYMAPEQHAGSPVSVLADQFAFATSLVSAIEEAGVAATVPARARAALQRALASRPEDRWPALPDLLHELAFDPAERRRRWVATVAVAAVVLGVGTAAFTLGRTAAMPDCGGGAALVAPLWDEAARGETREAFLRSGRPYAGETFVRVDGALRQRLGDWTRAHREACEATHLRHEQSPQMLDARMACLARARMDVDALVTLLRKGGQEAIDRAVTAVGRVGDLSACADLSALGAAMPPPPDPAVAAEVEVLRAELAHVTALRLLGKVQEGLQAGRKLVERARAVGYPPVLAAALEKADWFEITAGNTDTAVSMGYEAAATAAEARDDRLVADAMGSVAYALGFDGQRFEASEVAYHAAVTAAARAANPAPLLERLYGDRESVLVQRGDSLAALPLCQIVYAIDVRLHGLDSFQAALSLAEIADSMSRVGQPLAAAAMFDRALASAARALGPDHPVVIVILSNAGVNRLNVLDFDGAARSFERVMRNREQVFGPDDATTAISVHNLGIARMGQRRLPEARALFERAIRIRSEKLGPSHPLLATSYAELARVAELEGLAGEALVDLDRALAIKRAAYRGPHPSLLNSTRDKAELLVELGRLSEARATFAEVEALESKLATPSDRADTLKVAGAIELASRRPAAALADYQQALALLRAQHGSAGPALLDTLLGLGAAQLAMGDAARAEATADWAVAIATSHTVPADVECAAQLLLAQARWERGVARPSALALARATRARLAALPYPTAALARADRFLRRRAE